MLTREAWNAFLKTLEEPPPNTVFVLATTEAHKVMPTIVDRCQRFDFQRPSSEQIAIVLRRVAEAEGIEVDDGAVGVIARAATAASATRSAPSTNSSPTAAARSRPTTCSRCSASPTPSCSSAPPTRSPPATAPRACWRSAEMAALRPRPGPVRARPRWPTCASCWSIADARRGARPLRVIAAEPRAPDRRRRPSRLGEVDAAARDRRARGGDHGGPRGRRRPDDRGDRAAEAPPGRSSIRRARRCCSASSGSSRRVGAAPRWRCGDPAPGTRRLRAPPSAARGTGSTRAREPEPARARAEAAGSRRSREPRPAADRAGAGPAARRSPPRRRCRATAAAGRAGARARSRDRALARRARPAAPGEAGMLAAVVGAPARPPSTGRDADDRVPAGSAFNKRKAEDPENREMRRRGDAARSSAARCGRLTMLRDDEAGRRSRAPPRLGEEELIERFIASSTPRMRRRRGRPMPERDRRIEETS